MKIYAPDYYKNFQCLAGRCKHSCCSGWEVDIDEGTLAYYKTVEGDMGHRLEAAISYEGTPHFAMTDDGRCPFLNSCGLCDIMTNLGFDKVSDICDDHPRFYNFYSDRKEIGLGLSCEAVAKMIVEKQDKTRLVCIEDGEELLWEEECDFLYFRDDIFDILQNRCLPVDKRIEQVLEYRDIKLPDKTPARWAEIYLSLERLDEGWTDILERLKTANFTQIKGKWFETALEQLAVYFVYRHLLDGYDYYNLAGRLGFALVSTGIIRAVCCMQYREKGIFTLEDMAEICRMYSAEIEYNDENTGILMELLGNKN